MGGSIETTISFYKIKKGKGGKMGRFMKFTIRGVLRGVCSRILPRIAAWQLPRIAAWQQSCVPVCAAAVGSAASNRTRLNSVPHEASPNRNQLT